MDILSRVWSFLFVPLTPAEVARQNVVKHRAYKKEQLHTHAEEAKILILALVEKCSYEQGLIEATFSIWGRELARYEVCADRMGVPFKAEEDLMSIASEVVNYLISSGFSVKTEYFPSVDRNTETRVDIRVAWTDLDVLIGKTGV
jgi:hypothetical protein